MRRSGIKKFICLFQAEDGRRDLVRSRGLGDVYKRQKLYWHSTSHLMAQAVKNIFPKVKLAIGPSIDEGFYYDFDAEKPFTPEDLASIEKEMTRLSQENINIVPVSYSHLTLPTIYTV